MRKKKQKRHDAEIRLRLPSGLRYAIEEESNRRNESMAFVVREVLREAYTHAKGAAKSSTGGLDHESVFSPRSSGV